MKIGDSVSVIDDNLNGKITSVNGETVVFKDEHGFTHQFKKEKLVIQNPSIYENLKIISKPEIAKPISKKHDKKPFILDLHFEHLVKNPTDYDSFERLFLQKEKLLNTIDYCRKNNLKKLEIIHGIGDGVLQKMVHDVLESQTNLEFQNKEILHHQSGTVLVYFR
ncbi:Smr/MutS family protein [Kaistella sp.]|uniref:Smr/MutS family protein n=1 Tax=Kaistella sp. TaxID=2782235 RepID=UPI003C3E38FD